MLRISDARLDELLAEDVPYLDLTCEVLGVGQEPGRISYFTREDGVLCGTEEAARIMERLGLAVASAKPSGERIAAGETFLVAEGPAAGLHMAWKACLNLFDHCSAVATKTRRLVDAAKSANPQVEVLTTRKSMPGAKDLLTKAVVCGGAFPHRLGLSETVLVFDHHLTFAGGFDAFVERIPQLRARCIEKKLFMEVSADQARIVARAGIDGVQLDKVPAAELPQLVAELRQMAPHLTIIATGGINEQNAAAYAATGVDGLATTAPFTAKPLDMSVRMECVG